MNTVPGPNLRKLFIFIIYELMEKATVFALVKPFQHSIIFGDKAEAYPNEPHLRCTIQCKAPGFVNNGQKCL